MKFVIGRGTDASGGPVGHLGSYRALDGSLGAALGLDLDGPHAMLVVGKRGYGKSFTMGVIAEELARSSGVAPVIVDPMGVFTSLTSRATGECCDDESDTGDEHTDPVPATVLERPAVAPDSLDPQSWCALVGLSTESGAGSLLWRAAQRASTLEGMRSTIDAADAPTADKRAATNHLDLADSWGVFDANGIDAGDLSGPEVTVVDVSGLDAAPMNAVVRGIAESLYRARIDGTIDRLPWLMIDEAHTFFSGVAQPAIETILTRGRAPGVSLVSATQRPSAVPAVGISQSDVIISHRLTAQADLEVLEAAQPTYMNASLTDRMPERPGEIVVIDDATETIHTAQVRLRDTPHGGDSPRASEVSVDSTRSPQ